MVTLRDMAAGMAHRILHCVDCIGRTGRHGRDRAVQHRDVVVMIARRENVFARDLDQARQLGERRTFVVIGVTKAQVDGVALIVKLWLTFAGAFDKLGDAVHFFIARRDQTFQTLGMIEQARLCLLSHKIDNLGQDGLSRVKKLRVGAVAAVLGAWQLSGLFMNPIFISTPAAVLASFWEIVADGTLPRAFLSSLGEMVVGLAIATAVGFGLGIAMGRVRLVDRMFDPFVNFFNATPTIALLPLMEIWFGVDVRARVAFIVIICLWTLVINALAGVRNVQRGYAEVGTAFGLGELALTRKIFIPAAMPYLLTGMRVALAQATVGMILGGQEVGESGLGGLTEQYGSYFQTEHLIAAIIASTALAMMLFGVLKLVQHRFFPWIAASAADRR